MNVATLAENAGVSPHTIRYYEREGLLAPPPRTASGYRDYTPDELDRLRFIRGCQRLGLRLRDIKNLLDVRDTGSCPCEPAADLMKRRMVELDSEIRRLRTLRHELATISQRITTGPDCPEPTPGTWRKEVSPDARVPVLRRSAM